MPRDGNEANKQQSSVKQKEIDLSVATLEIVSLEKQFHFGFIQQVFWLSTVEFKRKKKNSDEKMSGIEESHLNLCAIKTCKYILNESIKKLPIKFPEITKNCLDGDGKLLADVIALVRPMLEEVSKSNRKTIFTVFENILTFFSDLRH